MLSETICGRKFEIDTPPTSPEELCVLCDKDNCITYTLYLYAVTHYNNPK